MKGGNIVEAVFYLQALIVLTFAIFLAAHKKIQTTTIILCILSLIAATALVHMSIKFLPLKSSIEWVFAVEFLVLTGLAGYAVYRNKPFWKNEKQQLPIILVEAVFLNFLLTWFVEVQTTTQSLPDAARVALNTTLSFLGGDSNHYFALLNGLSSACLTGTYRALGTVFVLMPALAAANILVIAGSLRSVLKIWSCALQLEPNIYVFSDLNENSLFLARSIHDNRMKKAGHKDASALQKIKGFLERRNRKEPVFFFLRCKKNSTELDADTRELLTAVHGQLFNGTETEFIHFSTGLAKNIRAFFFFSPEPNQNFNRAKDLLTEIPKEKNKDNKQREIFVLSDQPSGPLMIDSLRQYANPQGKNQNHLKIHLLDPCRSLCYHLLRKAPLFLSGQKKNTIMILGMGHFGTEFMRAATSFCVMNGWETSFYLWDRNITRQLSRFSLRAPYWKDDVDFSTKEIDVETTGFLEEYQVVSPYVSYLVIALGNDELNLQTTLLLGEFYLRARWKGRGPIAAPLICVRLKDPQKKEVLNQWYESNQLKEPGKSNQVSSRIEQCFRLHVFGCEDESEFSENILIPRNVWKAAEGLNNTHSDSNVSQDYDVPNEYKRRSSIACVSHAIYHVASRVPTEEDLKKTFGVSSEVNDNVLSVLDKYSCCCDEEKEAKAEHQRWMNYVRSEGMQYAELSVVRSYLSHTKNHVDAQAKLTPCLVPYEELGDLSGKINNLYQETSTSDNKKMQVQIKDFREMDRKAVRDAESIMEEIWKLSETQE